MPNYKKEVISINNKDYDIFIGKNALGNEEIINICHKESIWFHFDEISSPHIILESKGDDIPKEYLKKVGNILYLYLQKKHKTTKLRIIYAKVKNVELTDEPGTVITSNISYIK
jgi:predicted ribosome quality control (RQC) complex YloA/Tae2 family protein